MKNYNQPILFISILLLFFISREGFTQSSNNCNYKPPQQASNWVFGDNTRLDFIDSQSPTQIPGSYFGSGTEEAPMGVSAISDENGNLLLYSNGMNIWDGASNFVATGLNGYNGASMTSLIVPNPGNSNQYYVFTVDLFVEDVFTNGINYTIVEYVNNSYWTIVAKNLPFLSENSQKICAIQHENEKDFWIITHGLGPNKGENFYVNLFSDSLNLSPQVYKVGRMQTYDPTNFNSYNNGGGYLKASQDGTKLAQAVFHDGYVEVFDFNRSTGEISNAQSSQIGTYIGPFGIEFSPDASKLYVTTAPLNDLTNFLYQIDLDQPDPLDNPFEIDRLEMIGTEKILFGSLQLATDGKIYINKYLKSIYPYPGLGVIYNPNRAQYECNYNTIDGDTDMELVLEYGNSFAGLPAFPSSFLDIPHFYYLNQCFNDTTNFIIRNTTNLTPSWEFNDPSGLTDLSNPLYPKHVFSDSGTFNVSLTETHNNINYEFTREVTINPLPSVNIGMGSNVIYILQGSSIRLDAGEGMDVYSWNPGGSTDRYLDVDQEGIYIATVTDFNCCSNSDTVEIKFASLSFPNAFIPAGTISENQTFGVDGNVSAIAEYQFRIFDRWGKIVFETNDPLDRWDGNYNGDPLPRGTFVYSAVFTSFESAKQASIDVKDTGTVTIIR